MVENWDQYKNLEYYFNRFCACGCDGGIEVRSNHKYYGIPRYIKGHANRGLEKIPREMRICKCDCKGTFECTVNSKQRFIWGHQRRNAKHTKEAIEKIREANVGKKLSEETIKKIRKASIGRHHSEETKEKMSNTRLELWQNPKFVEMMLEVRGRGPNKPEKFLINLLQELFPNQWKYVGDGAFWITSNGKHLNPDFIRLDGRKKIIEHFGDYHHGEGKTGVSNTQHEQERKNSFAHQGYQTLIVWEHELEDTERLKSKILEFNQV